MIDKSKVFELMHNVKCVIFDLDDTLLYTCKNAFLKTNIVAIHYKEDQITEEAFFESYGKKTISECIKTWFKKIDETQFEKVYSRLSLDIPYRPVCDFSKLQQELKECRKEIGILTNSKLNTSLLKKLDAINLNTKLIDYIYTSDTVVARKPSGKAFTNLLKKSGLEPNKILYIGDSYDDYCSCVEAGVIFVPVNTGVIKWRNESVYFYLESVNELITLVREYCELCNN